MTTTKNLQLVKFFVDHNTNECLVSFGLPFNFLPLCDLPKEKDGKSIVVLGMKPHTVELVINIPFDKMLAAYDLTNSRSIEIPALIERLQSLAS